MNNLFYRSLISDGRLLAIQQGNYCLPGELPLNNVRCPIDGNPLYSFGTPGRTEVVQTVRQAKHAFSLWQQIPPPRRGELVRRFGNLAREHKQALAELITLEAGKIEQEALGEVQEMIDVCDFAVGLSRQLYGLTISSERHTHRMMEQWHPLGIVAIITAFNFPMAVWAWNAMLALVCGNTLIWKPSEQTPLCALACQHLLEEAMATMEDVPEHISAVILGSKEVSTLLVDQTEISLVSATGSCQMGKAIACRVAGRLGRYLLELGGNNAMILAPTANLDLAIRAVVFAAVGTAGQRCTSLRRLFVHAGIYDVVRKRLLKAYETLPIGDPRQTSTLVGPLINENAWQRMIDAIVLAEEQGGSLLTGGHRISDLCGSGIYVQPAIVEMPKQTAIVEEETFAPLLYLIKYHDFDEAMQMHNAVPQGLSSAIFTNDLREAEMFMGPIGSDCGIANVNIGTSGAEIGGAFGGEKDTGGGRESGSDAWKNYMRRVTNTINYGNDLPLAQGIRFDT